MLVKEMKDRDGDKQYSIDNGIIFHESRDNLNEVHATVLGPVGTPYEGGYF